MHCYVVALYIVYHTSFFTPPSVNKTILAPVFLLLTHLLKFNKTMQVRTNDSFKTNSNSKINLAISQFFA